MAKRYPEAKLSYLKDFKDKLEDFYYDTIDIKPNDEDQIEDLEKRRIVFKKAEGLYHKLQNLFKTANKK